MLRLISAVSFGMVIFSSTCAPQTSNSVPGLLRSGTTALSKGDLSAAEKSFREAAAAEPNSAQAHMGLGLVLLREGQAESAAMSLRLASTLDPTLGGARLFLGIANYQLGHSEEAERDLRAELTLAPDSVEAMTWLTIVLMGSNRAAEAVPVVDRAVALQPNDAQLLYFQSKAHEAMAKVALGKLYALDPDSALVHQATAESLDGAGDVFKSVQEYEAALKKRPQDTDLLEALGEEQQKAGQGQAAAATFQRVLALNPNSAPALLSLGRLDVEQGEAAEGVDLLRQAQEVHAAASPTALYLGLGLARLGKNEEAERSLKASLTPDASLFVQQSAWYQLARVYARLGRKADEQNALAQLKKVESLRNADVSGSESSHGSTAIAAPAGKP